MLRPAVLALAAAAMLAGCASSRRGTPDNEPTLKTLTGRQLDVSVDTGVKADEAKAIDAWKKFLDASPSVRSMPERAQAMRRIGDLEMELTDQRVAKGEGGLAASGAPDYQAAVARYRAYLADYPKAADRDRVLYQLGRAQEQGGDLAGALQTLDGLMAAHPDTAYRDEVQFRRGELLFAARNYAGAEAAYGAVLLGAPEGNFRSRALYMQGWSRFKRGNLDEALKSFFGVLDLTLGPVVASSPGGEPPASDANGAASTPAAGSLAAGDSVLPPLPGLSRADRELVDDTLRVTSISLSGLDGAASIGSYTDAPLRKGYEVHVFRSLAGFYLKQERINDATDTLVAFGRRQPMHTEAPRLDAQAIAILREQGFPMQALEGMRDFATRYALDGAYQRENASGWAAAKPLLRQHLAELARHHHALALQARKPVAAVAVASAASSSPRKGAVPAAIPSADGGGLPAAAAADVREAVRWYRQTIATFPGEPATAAQHFLMAELLYDDRQYADAAAAYEKAAYDYAPHARAADAGYAALLAQAARERDADPAVQRAAREAGVASALRFVERFGDDPRRAAVLTRAAEQRFALADADGAATLARQLLALQPVATPEQRRVAWTVIAHGAFDRGRFDEAEKAYAEVVKLVPAGDKAQSAMLERQAAAIYRQGEQARDHGDARDAVAHFERIAAVAPSSEVRAAAQFDAAVALIGLTDWAGATRLLEDFRQRFPQHPLQAELGPKLVLVRLEQQQWKDAADEYDRLAAAKRQQDPTLSRDATWQAAELREKSVAQGRPRSEALQAWEQYLKAWPQPLESAVEARQRLATLSLEDGQPQREQTWLASIVQADAAGGSARTPRTKTLAAQASLKLAAPTMAAFREVALVEPLQQQLKLKKTRMEAALKAYAAAADYGIAEVTTAATFETASIYQDFGKALMSSQRPASLSKAELEQYEVLLEEQAFPFEEKAIELHELNAHRAGDGLYDDWVRRSYAALGSLRPVRYGKTEKLEEQIDAIR